MAGSPFRSVVLPLCVVVLLSVAAWTSARDAAPAVEAAPGGEVKLGGADRYLTHLSTDKPMYRPGESLRARGVLLHAFNRKPLPGETPAIAELEIVGPKGDTVAGGIVSSADSVVGFGWEIPEGTPGGEYTLKVAYPWQGYAPAERKFDVRAYRAPRLKTQIVFLRDGYGPGDNVDATVSIERAEGGVPEGAKVTAVARVDGVEVHRGPAELSNDGIASAAFKLPAAIERGEGTLAFVIEDGGVVETASKTLPILLQTLDISFYPEGGDLIGGVSNRVYFEAKQPNTRPADLAGKVTDSTGKTVAQVKTEHEGRGRFSFTPRDGETYNLHITAPAGISRTFALPEAKASGVAIHTDKDVYGHGEAITLSVAAVGLDTPIKVRMTQRETLLSMVTLPAEVAARTAEDVKPAAVLHRIKDTFSPQRIGEASGVLTITVLDEADKPLAERLVYRKPAREVKIDIKADRPRYTPADEVRVTVTTTDATSGQPVGAVVGLTVTDDSVLEMIEKRQQSPRLPVMAFFENEVKDLADAHVYLDPENEKAPLATDLLLGTQGWRRYSTMRVVDFIKAHGDDAVRALALLRVDPSRRHEHMVTKNGQWLVLSDLKSKSAVLKEAQVLRKGGRGRFLDEMDGAVPGAAMPRAAMARPEAVQNAVAPMEGAEVAELGAAAGEGGAVAADDDKPAQVPAAEPAVELPRDPADAEAVEAKDDAVGLALKVRREDRARIAFDQDMAEPAMTPPPPSGRADFVVVREYAHAVREGRTPGDRRDFAETLYFNAGVRTNPADGSATVSFHLSDAVTGFRVLADAFTDAGALGSGDTLIESVEPFYIEPKLPLELTSGDVVQLPVAAVNGTTGKLDTVKLEVTVPSGIGVTAPGDFALAADGRERRLIPLETRTFVGPMPVTIAARAGHFGDRNTRSVVVKPMGFPVEVGFGGLLEGSSKQTHKITIPKDVVAHSVSTKIEVFPSPLANMTSALERMIREPNGCFEQTSSTTYPLVMAQQYFLSHHGVDPALIQRSAAILDKGYDRLVGFECKSGGYEWFGEDPGHEALTAYGLMQFADMSKVKQIDTAMLSRTNAWLLNQRDGDGGFKRERRALHTWIEDPDSSNSYILWSLLRSGTPASELTREIDSLLSRADKAANSYVVAMSANVAAEAGRKEVARELLGRLTELQHKDGFVDGATTSIVGSGGEALAIETTALATLAWLRDDHFAGNVERSYKWLAEACKAGRFGSTQSTVLALQAIVEYDKARATPRKAGSVQLVIDGRKAGSAVKFDTDQKGSIVLTDISELLTPGEHTVELIMDDGSRMPYSIAVNYNRVQPDSSDASKLTIEATLKDTKMTEGDITEANVRVSNRTDKVLPSSVAIVGIPAGLEVRHDQLKELRDRGTIAAYEVLGREVVLYWRTVGAKQVIDIPLSLTAAVPGSYTGPASRTYEYYTDEHKQWASPLVVTIAPR